MTCEGRRASPIAVPAPFYTVGWSCGWKLDCGQYPGGGRRAHDDAGQGGIEVVLMAINTSPGANMAKQEARSATAETTTRHTGGVGVITPAQRPMAVADPDTVAVRSLLRENAPNHIFYFAGLVSQGA